MECSRGAFIFLIVYCSVLTAVILVLLIYFLFCRRKTKKAVPVSSVQVSNHKSRRPEPDEAHINIAFEDGDEHSVDLPNINRTSKVNDLRTVDSDGNLYRSANEDSDSSSVFEDVISLKSRQSHPSVSNTTENYKDVRKSSSSSSSSSSSASSIVESVPKKKFSHNEFNKNINEFRASVEPQRRKSSSSSSSSRSTLTSIDNELEKIERVIPATPSYDFTPAKLTQSKTIQSSVHFPFEAKIMKPAGVIPTKKHSYYIDTDTSLRDRRKSSSSSSSSNTTTFMGEEPGLEVEGDITVVDFQDFQSVSSRSSSVRSTSSQAKIATKVSESSLSSSDKEERNYHVSSGQTRSYVSNDYSLPRWYPPSNDYQKSSYFQSETISKPKEQVQKKSSSSSDSSSHDEKMYEEIHIQPVQMAQRVSVTSSEASENQPIGMARKVSESSNAASEDRFPRAYQNQNIVFNEEPMQMARKVSVSSSAASEDQFRQEDIQMARKVSVSSSNGSEIQTRHHYNTNFQDEQIKMARRVSVMSSSAASSEDGNAEIGMATRVSVSSTSSSSTLNGEERLAMEFNDGRTTRLGKKEELEFVRSARRSSSASDSSSSSDTPSKTIAEANISLPPSRLNSSESLSSKIFSELGTMRPGQYSRHQTNHYSGERDPRLTNSNFKGSMAQNGNLRKIEVRTSSSSCMTSEEEDQESKKFRETILNFDLEESLGKIYRGYDQPPKLMKECSRVDELSESAHSSSDENSNKVRKFEVEAGRAGNINGVIHTNKGQLPPAFRQLNSNYESVYSSRTTDDRNRSREDRSEI